MLPRIGHLSIGFLSAGHDSQAAWEYNFAVLDCREELLPPQWPPKQRTTQRLRIKSFEGILSNIDRMIGQVYLNAVRNRSPSFVLTFRDLLAPPFENFFIGGLQSR